MGAVRIFALLLVFTVVSGCGPETPRVVAVAPLVGDSGGGTTVRFSGAGFVDHGPVVVYFGMRSARAVVIVDDRLITVVSPEAEALGPTDLKVVYGDGTEIELPHSYSYTSEDGKLKPIPFMPGRPPPDGEAG